MKARFIFEGIKHLSPKSDEEILRYLESQPILDQIQQLDKQPALKRKLLPFSNKTKQEIRKAIIKEIPTYMRSSLYGWLAAIENQNSRYLDWLYNEVHAKLIKKVNAVAPNKIKQELDEALNFYVEEWVSRDRKFPPVIEILLKKAKENKIDVMSEDLFNYMYEIDMDFMPYIVNFPSDPFRITKKGKTFIIEFAEWSDFAPYFKESRDVDEDFIKAVLSGEGSEYFIGYRDDVEFPSFSEKFLNNIKSIFPEFKAFVAKKYPEANKFKNIHQLWNFLEQLENEQELDRTIRYPIVKATNETIEVSEEDEAYKELKEAITDFFQIKNVEYQNSNKHGQHYIGTISKEGAKTLITMLYSSELIEGIDYRPPHYGWMGDVEKFPDVFTDALLGQI